jgi:hypothetical protein
MTGSFHAAVGTLAVGAAVHVEFCAVVTATTPGWFCAVTTPEQVLSLEPESTASVHPALP